MTRKIIVLALLLCMFLGASARLYFLSSREYVNAGVSGATKTVEVSSLRGNIYDCNFEKLVNCSEKTVVAAKPCTQSADLLKDRLTQQQFLKLLSCIGKGEMFLEMTDDFYCNEETVKTAKIFDRYTKDQTACHIIGYINSADNIGVSGIEKSFDGFLKEDHSLLKLKFSTNAKNATLAGDKIEFVSDNYTSKKGVVLTIDKQIQKICENAMKLYSNDCGACVVLHAGSSHIKAVVSAPSFENANIAKDLENEKSPLLNRALNAYSVGSVFKTVVAAAAEKNGLADFKYDCKGQVKIGDRSFYCSSHISHGKEDLSAALANSCNTYFVSLAMEIGAKKLIEIANNLGFGQKYVLCEDIVGDGGSLPDESEIVSDGNLANLAFGQGDLLATPLQVAVCYGAMITDGTLRFPKLILGQVDTEGHFFENKDEYFCVRALDEKVASETKKLLSDNFGFQNYACAKPSYECACGGKTSTAQTGWYDEEGNEIFHSWFAGYVSVEDEDYVIVVFKENGTSGAADCAPIFKEIADRIIIYLRKS